MHQITCADKSTDESSCVWFKNLMCCQRLTLLFGVLIKENGHNDYRLGKRSSL